MDVVPPDILALLRLHVQDAELLDPDNVAYRPVQRKILSGEKDTLKYEDTLHVPLTRHDKHL